MGEEDDREEKLKAARQRLRKFQQQKKATSSTSSDKKNNTKEEQEEEVKESEGEAEEGLDGTRYLSSSQDAIQEDASTIVRNTPPSKGQVSIATSPIAPKPRIETTNTSTNTTTFKAQTSSIATSPVKHNTTSEDKGTSPLTPQQKHSDDNNKNESNSFYLNLYREAQNTLQRERQEHVKFRQQASGDLSTLTNNLKATLGERDALQKEVTSRLNQLDEMQRLHDEMSGSLAEYRDRLDQLQQAELDREKTEERDHKQSESARQQLDSLKLELITREGQFKERLAQEKTKHAQQLTLQSSQNEQKLNQQRESWEQEKANLQSTFQGKARDLEAMLRGKIEESESKLRKSEARLKEEKSLRESVQRQLEHSEHKLRELESMYREATTVNAVPTSPIIITATPTTSSANSHSASALLNLQKQVDELQEENSRLLHDLNERVRRDQQVMINEEAHRKKNINSQGTQISPTKVSTKEEVQLGQVAKETVQMAKESTESKNNEAEKEMAIRALQVENRALLHQLIQARQQLSILQQQQRNNKGDNNYMASKIRVSEIEAREKAVAAQEARMLQIERALTDKYAELVRKTANHHQASSNAKGTGNEQSIKENHPKRSNEKDSQFLTINVKHNSNNTTPGRSVNPSPILPPPFPDESDFFDDEHHHHQQQLHYYVPPESPGNQSTFTLERQYHQQHQQQQQQLKLSDLKPSPSDEEKETNSYLEKYLASSSNAKTSSTSTSSKKNTQIPQSQSNTNNKNIFNYPNSNPINTTFQNNMSLPSPIQEDIIGTTLTTNSPLSSPSTQYYELLKIILQLSSYNRQLTDRLKKVTTSSNANAAANGVKGHASGRGLKKDEEGSLSPRVLKDLSEETRKIIEDLNLLEGSE